MSIAGRFVLRIDEAQFRSTICLPEKNGIKTNGVVSSQLTNDYNTSSISFNILYQPCPVKVGQIVNKAMWLYKIMWTQPFLIMRTNERVKSTIDNCFISKKKNRGNGVRSCFITFYLILIYI